MHILTDIVLLGVCLFWVRKLFVGRRPVAPLRAPEHLQERPAMTPARRDLPKTARASVAASAPAITAELTVRTGYLLDHRAARDGRDPTTAMMDILSGPGICTQRDHSRP